jgi:hypothetical protein
MVSIVLRIGSESEINIQLVAVAAMQRNGGQ